MTDKELLEILKPLVKSLLKDGNYIIPKVDMDIIERWLEQDD